MPESRHITVWIDKPADEVYAFASVADNMPRWAAGVGVLGDIGLEFAATNEFGVLDHEVTLATGEKFYNPMRAIPAGFDEPRCEVVFTLRRADGGTDEQFEADAAAVTADLHTLKRLMEAD